MKFSEIKNKSKTELKEMLISKLQELFHLRMQRTEENLKTHLFKKLRKEVARIKTILNESV